MFYRKASNTHFSLPLASYTSEIFTFSVEVKEHFIVAIISKQK